jgi:hypothetical protein
MPNIACTFFFGVPLVAGVTVVHHRWLKQYKLGNKISHLCNIWLFFTEREKGG